MEKPLRFLRLPEVKIRVGLGHDTIYRGAREGWFPKPVKISNANHASGFIESEIDEYLAKRIAERDSKADADVTAKPKPAKAAKPKRGKVAS